MTTGDAALPRGAAHFAPFRRFFAYGRWGRGVLAWLVAAISAVLLGVTLTIAFLLVREVAVSPPFPQSEWWVFLNLWRPLLTAGAVLVPLFSGPLAALSVWFIRRNRWRRPLADVVAGAACGLGALTALLVIAHQFGPMGDGP